MESAELGAMDFFGSGMERDDGVMFFLARKHACHVSLQLYVPEEVAESMSYVIAFHPYYRSFHHAAVLQDHVFGDMSSALVIIFEVA